MTRCGFVAVVGAPNAGKSTLVNALTGMKISIVSPRVQTTRTRVLGIMTEAGSQVALIDTPGIFKPGKRFERAMVGAATGSIRDADLVALVVDASRKGAFEDNRVILEEMVVIGRPAILVLNKIDRISPESLLFLAQTFSDALPFLKVFMISALKGDGVGDVRAYMAGAVPEGPFLYPEDQASDMPARLLAAEITREKLFLQLREELPYAVAVETESWEDRADGSVRIGQVVYVAREQHRAIVLGKGGTMIKAVGEVSRRELSRILEQTVHLFLHVKVRENWDRDPDLYRLWGLDPLA